MKDFIDSNPGLQSRFTNYIEFPDYSDADLYAIFEARAKKYNYELDDEAAEYLRNSLKITVENKTRNFGNGRYVRNVFEKCVSNQANRLARLTNPTEQELTILTKDDVEKACLTVAK